MAINKTKTGYQVDVRPAGRNGRRFRKSFATRSEAASYEKYVIAEYKDANPWDTPTKDKRRLDEIANDWYKFHGYSLETGDTRLSILLLTIKALGNPVAVDVKPTDFLEYRKKRLKDGITENHLNHELTYLKAAFNELIRIDNWKSPNPYGNIKKLKMDERELVFLTLEEIDKLLNEIEKSRNKDALLITKICLSTGCRWGEAQELRGEQIHHGKLHFAKTKTGKNRSIPISEDLESEIFESRPKRGKLFIGAWGSFRSAINRSQIELPKGQNTHVLRHTFASHYMMSGGNLLDLNKILGHKTIQMTMTYAHLAPEHLESAKRRNPLTLLHKCGQNVDIAISS